MSLQDYLTAIGDFILANLGAVVFSIIALAAGYIAYKLIGREINRLTNQKKIEESLAYTFKRITKWIIVALVLSAILAQFGATIELISGLLAIVGGTVIGFAAINTIGNALAGLIVMTSRPFIVGDRIFFNGQFADVVAIDLIYTKMLTLDNVLVSIPNQELLKSETDNYGKKRLIRRHCTVTPGFEYDVADVRKALLEAAGKVQGVLQEPKAYVWITKFQNYAVEYTLYVFISDIKRLPEIDADLHEKVFETCKEHKIDISTPLLLKRVTDQTGDHA
jgi:small-conductance mechanosensitive channel